LKRTFAIAVADANVDHLAEETTVDGSAGHLVGETAMEEETDGAADEKTPDEELETNIGLELSVVLDTDLQDVSVNAGETIDYILFISDMFSRSGPSPKASF
jgi:hypothetical protein